LDGSIKKNTAFIRKLKTSLSAGNQASLIKDIQSLKLEKYLSEIATAIVEAKLVKSGDVTTAVEVCSEIHQRFADFAPLLLESLAKTLNFTPMVYPPGVTLEHKEKEESARILRLRGLMRLQTELYLVGISRDGSKEGVISIMIKQMV
jgi:regulator of nonsense transcripts 2